MGGDLVVNEIQHRCFGICTGNKILCYGFSNYSHDVRIIYHDERIYFHDVRIISHAVRIITEVVLDVFICGVNLFSSVAKG